MNQRTLTVTQLRRLQSPTYRVPLHVSPDGAVLAVSVMRDEPGAEVHDAQGLTPSGLPGEAVGSRVLVVNTATGAVEEPFSGCQDQLGRPVVTRRHHARRLRPAAGGATGPGYLAP